MIMDESHHAQNNIDFKVRALILLFMWGEANDVEGRLLRLSFDGESLLLGLQDG